MKKALYLVICFLGLAPMFSVKAMEKVEQPLLDKHTQDILLIRQLLLMHESNTQATDLSAHAFYLLANMLERINEITNPALIEKMVSILVKLDTMPFMNVMVMLDNKRQTQKKIPFACIVTGDFPEQQAILERNMPERIIEDDAIKLYHLLKEVVRVRAAKKLELAHPVVSEDENPSSLIPPANTGADAVALEKCHLCMDSDADITLSCNHIGCWSCLRQWHSVNNRCSFCRQLITIGDAVTLGLGNERHILQLQQAIEAQEAPLEDEDDSESDDEDDAGNDEAPAEAAPEVEPEEAPAPEPRAINPNSLYETAAAENSWCSIS